MTSMGTVRRLLRFRRWIPIGVTVAIAAWVCVAAAPQAFSQDPASIGARLVTGERHPLLFLSEPSPVESATGTVSTASSSGVRFEREWLGDPRSAAAADFNGDGMPDLLVGYGSLDGAFVTLYAGNVDYLFPEAARTWLNEPHAASNDSPFLPGARTVPVPVSLTDFRTHCWSQI
ncbi:MAG: FG-GAP repeat protein [Acidobacteriota bacterium]